MNRIASLVAGTVTTAFVGASIAAVSASQGVLPGWGNAGGQADGSWEDAAQALQDQWAGVAISAPDVTTPEGTVAPTVIYVDKEPIVITKEIVLRSKEAAPAPASRALDAPTVVPTNSAAPPLAPAAAPSGAPPPSSGGGAEAPAGFSPQAPGPVAPSPTASMAPPPAVPVETFASAGVPTGSSWGDDDDDYAEGEEDDDEDEPEEEDEREDEDEEERD
jgi:hypothetical protein